jgi:hypothetical protein
MATLTIRREYRVLARLLATDIAETKQAIKLIVLTDLPSDFLACTAIILG